MDNDLADLLTKLNVSTTPDQAWQLAETYLNNMGAKSLVYAAGTTLENLDFYVTTPDWWMPHYIENNYVIDDPVSRAAREQVNPFNISKERVENARTISLTGIEKKVSLEFFETGINSAAFIPLRLPDSPDSIGSFMFSSELNMDEFQTAIDDIGLRVHMAALYTHTTLQRLLHDQSAQAISLTAREKECLLWLSRGMQSEQIADRLKIARVTVDMHIGNAKRKLGASTREHTLVMAIQQNLIAP